MKFGDVVRLVKETCKAPLAAGIERVIGLEHLEPGDLRVRSWNDVADGTTFTTRVRPGQVLFGKRRAYQRKVAVADFDAICSGDIYVFESANPAKLLPDLLPFLCQTDAFFEHAVGTSAGSLSPRTNWSSLARYEFALPPPEQQPRILARLRQVRRHAESIADLREALVQQRDAVCQWWATAHGARLAPDGTVPAGELPASWEVATLQDLCPERNALVIGPFGSDLVASDYQHSSGVPVVFVADVVRYRFAYSSNRFVTMKKADALAAHHAVPGDVLITKMGWPPGEACVVPPEFERGIVTADVVRARLNTRRISPEYLVAVLNSHWGQQQVVRVSPGTTRPKTTLASIGGIALAVPPLEQQTALIDALRALQAQIHETERYARESERLLAVMAAAAWGSNVQ
ncbi:restriction endonuclease subunit S [Sorangium sp. So ce1389]|uniref:restriction endonuclease subunit S n=1 Tax=Sorangium sp. So ce1389 TaxID=3133336 RepID=UPI003F63E843